MHPFAFLTPALDRIKQAIIYDYLFGEREVTDETLFAAPFASDVRVVLVDESCGPCCESRTIKDD